jgi:hypothetical protein
MAGGLVLNLDRWGGKIPGMPDPSVNTNNTNANQKSL